MTDEWIELGKKRAEALEASLKHTLDECKEKFRKEHPDLPEWYVDFVHHCAINNLRFK